MYEIIPPKKKMVVPKNLWSKLVKILPVNTECTSTKLKGTKLKGTKLKGTKLKGTQKVGKVRKRLKGDLRIELCALRCQQAGVGVPSFRGTL